MNGQNTAAIRYDLRMVAKVKQKNVGTSTWIGI